MSFLRILQKSQLVIIFRNNESSYIGFIFRDRGSVSRFLLAEIFAFLRMGSDADGVYE